MWPRGHRFVSPTLIGGEQHTRSDGVTLQGNGNCKKKHPMNYKKLKKNKNQSRVTERKHAFNRVISSHDKLRKELVN